MNLRGSKLFGSCGPWQDVFVLHSNDSGGKKSLERQSQLKKRNIYRDIEIYRDIDIYRERDIYLSQPC